MSRAYTKEEARTVFMKQVKHIAKYWAKVSLEPERDSIKERCEGVVFSILSLIDGSSIGLPALDLVLRPHESDKQYHQDLGSKYFTDGMSINDNTVLHEGFHNEQTIKNTDKEEK